MVIAPSMKNYLLVDAFSFSFPSYELRLKLILPEESTFPFEPILLMSNAGENSLSEGYPNSKTRMTVLEKSLFRLLCCGFVFFTLKKSSPFQNTSQLALSHGFVLTFLRPLSPTKTTCVAWTGTTLPAPSAELWDSSVFLKLLQWSIFIRKLGDLKVILSTAPVPGIVPHTPDPIQPAQHPLGSCTRHWQQLPAHAVCQWFGPSALHHTGMCLNLIDFSRTRELYWADALVGWNAGATPPPSRAQKLLQRATDTQRLGWNGWIWWNQTSNPTPELDEFWTDTELGCGPTGPAAHTQPLSEAQKAKMAQMVSMDYTWHVVNTDPHTPYYLPVTK